jgi:histidinol-phosphate aminotransferase
VSDDPTSAVLQLARPAIRALAPYAHAHWDPQLERLHANESPWAPPAQAESLALNRYPEPQPHALLEAMADYCGVGAENVVVGRGSDELIDLLTRVFCEAGRDAVVICPPTFGMYAVAAHVQGARVIEVPLRDDLSLNLEALSISLEQGAKLIWLCSPNNPTGHSLPATTIESVVALARGRAVVMVDEAYIEFSSARSWCQDVNSEPGLAVLRTLSKAHALAGIRLGALIAHPVITALVRKIIPPYAVPQPTVDAALRALQPAVLAITNERIKQLIAERNRLATALLGSPWVERIYPSDANFLLLGTLDPETIMSRAASSRLLLRNFSGRGGLAGAVRVSIGTVDQNNRLLAALEASVS